MANTLTLEQAKEIVETNELIGKKLMEILEPEDFMSLARTFIDALATKPPKKTRYNMASLILDTLEQLQERMTKKELFAFLVDNNHLETAQWESFRSAVSNIKNPNNPAGKGHPLANRFRAIDGCVELTSDLSAKYWELIAELEAVNDEDRMADIIEILASN